MEPSINKSGIFAPDFSERDTVMTNNRLKGFTYGAVAAASYGMNPLCGFRPLLPLLFRRCDAGHPDESEETVLCAEEDGYTSAGGNGAVVLFFLVLSLREL